MRYAAWAWTAWGAGAVAVFANGGYFHDCPWLAPIALLPAAALWRSRAYAVLHVVFKVGVVLFLFSWPAIGSYLGVPGEILGGLAVACSAFAFQASSNARHAIGGTMESWVARRTRIEVAASAAPVPLRVARVLCAVLAVIFFLLAVNPFLYADTGGRGNLVMLMPLAFFYGLYRLAVCAILKRTRSGIMP